MPADLILVNDAIIGLIVAEAIAPYLRKLEEGLATTFRVLVHQWTPSQRRAAPSVWLERCSARGRCAHPLSTQLRRRSPHDQSPCSVQSERGAWNGLHRVCE